MVGAITAAIGAIGKVIGGLFGFKKEQGEIIKSALGVIGDINSSDDARAAAVATVISAEANSDSWIARSWRPLLMVSLSVIIISSWFGYSPPHINEPMGPMLTEIFGILKIGVMGYIPARTVEKLAKQFQIGQVLRTYIQKKFM